MTVNQSRYLVLPDPDRHKPRPPRKVKPPPFLPENRPLTKKQEKFVRELVENTGRITLREAAEKAGYSARGASVRASELTNPTRCPHVVKRILEVRAEMKIKYGIDEDQHLADLWRLREESLSNGAFSAAVAAEKIRGSTAGLHVSKSEIRHGSIDQMSRSDVERELIKIRESFAPLMATPHDESSDGEKPRVQLLEASSDKPT